MARKKTPYLTSRIIQLKDKSESQIFRWNVGPHLRKNGFKSFDLWADGPIFSVEDWRDHGFDQAYGIVRKKGLTPLTYAAAALLCRNLTSWARAQAGAKRGFEAVSSIRGIAPRPQKKLTEHLIDDYAKDIARQIRMGALSAKTGQQYSVDLRKAAKIFGPVAPHSITKDLLRTYHATIAEKQGAHAATKAAAMMTRLFAWAEGDEKWRHLIPASTVYRNLGLAKPEARLRIGSADEMQTLLRAFDHPALIYAELETPQAERLLMPAPSMGDALIAMLWSCARVNDVLSFQWPAIEGGRLVYRQQKTGRIVDVPVMAGLAERLPAMRRRSDALRRNQADNTMIVSEIDGSPYWRRRASGVKDHRPFNDRWAAHRELAGKICPSLIGAGKNRLGASHVAFNAQDCRDTAVTRLALAGATMAEIAAWHGSSVEVIVTLCRAYLAVGAEHADAGAEKLSAWAHRQGVVV